MKILAVEEKIYKMLMRQSADGDGSDHEMEEDEDEKKDNGEEYRC